MSNRREKKASREAKKKIEGAACRGDGRKRREMVEEEEDGEQ